MLYLIWFLFILTVVILIEQIMPYIESHSNYEKGLKRTKKR